MGSIRRLSGVTVLTIAALLVLAAPGASQKRRTPPPMEVGRAAQDWSGTSGVGVEVRDRDGHPIEGAEVRLAFADGGSGAGPEAANESEGPAPVATDASGRAAIRGLAEGEWVLTVRHPETMAYVATLQVRHGKRPREVNASQVKVSDSLRSLRLKYFEESGPAERVAAGAPAARRVAPTPRPTPERMPAKTAPPMAPPTPPQATPPEPQPPAMPEPEPTVAPAEGMKAEPSAGPAAEQVPAPAAQPAEPMAAEEPAAMAPAPTEAPSGSEAKSEAVESVTPAEEMAAPPTTAEPEPMAEPAPMPEPAPMAEPAATPDEMTAPPPAPAPAVEPPAPMPEAAAPATAPRRATLRSYEAGTCPECRPGEWSVTAEGSAAAGTGACPEDLQARLDRAAALLGSSRALAPWTGPIELAGGASSVLGNEAYREFTEAVRDVLADDASCRVLAVILPSGARFVGLEMGVADGGSWRQCLPGKECLAGGGWTGDPRVVRTPAGPVLAAAYGNAGSAAQRVRLTVYFKAPEGWAPR